MTTVVEQTTTAAAWIATAKHVVAFTGAGISTDSGLPDFRGPDGVWTRRDKGLPPPARTKAVIRPNAAHMALVRLQELGRLAFLISQNVDNLHRQSGIDPDRLAELHGNQDLVECESCLRRFTLAEAGWDRSRHGNGYRTDARRPDQPVCARCGGRLVSSIVNFGDSLPVAELLRSESEAKACDIFLAVGSSLAVSPANELPEMAREQGARLILINIGDTPLDDVADLRIEAPIGEVLPAIADRVADALQ